MVTKVFRHLDNPDVSLEIIKDTNKIEISAISHGNPISVFLDIEDVYELYSDLGKWLQQSKHYLEAKAQAESKLQLEKEIQITLEQHLKKTYGKQYVEGMKKKPALISKLKYELDPITKEVKIINNG